MKCPTCESCTGVIDTRKHEDGVWRQRKCPNGHRFWTREVVEEPRKGLFYSKDYYQRLKGRKYEW